MPSDSAALPFEIRPSPMQGLGAFATRRIPAGVRLIEYAGERLTPREADERYPDVEGERHHTFLFAID
jgi:SET domain-containing protein